MDLNIKFDVDYFKNLKKQKNTQYSKVHLKVINFYKFFFIFLKKSSRIIIIKIFTYKQNIYFNTVNLLFICTNILGGCFLKNSL